MRTQLGSAGLVVLVAAAASLAACVGDIGDRNNGHGSVNGPTASTGSGCVTGCTESGIQIAPSSQFPRLSHTQWEQTVVDLFQLDAPTGLSSSFAPDPLGGKAFDNNEGSLEVTPTLWADYQSAAETVAAMVTSDAALLAHIVPADLPTDPTEKARAFLTSFGARVYRRPLETAEVDAKKDLFDKGATLYPDLDPFVAGVRLTLEAFLQSPHFVYRPELATVDQANGLIELSSWELASRISYSIWNTMPDDELFQAAAKGDLDGSEGLTAQVDRLLADPRARPTLRAFYEQLYQTDQYTNLSKSPTLYPDFDPAVGTDMRAELVKFVDHVNFDLKGGVRELLTSNTTFVTPGLAAIYGVSSAQLGTPDADGFSKVDLDPAERSGLLTRAGFLAWKGTETQPDTILRGVFINRKIICQVLGDPPDAAMGAKLGSEATNRERVNALTGPGTCGASCHGTYINPAGYALEHYGALGEYRTEDNGHPIDSSATFPFEAGPQTYDDAIEFSKVLAENPQVHACFAGFWVEYLLGRSKVTEDKALIDLLAKQSLEGASTVDVVKALLVSDAIRYRLATKEEP